MHEWLNDAREKLADATGDDPTVYALEQRDSDALLELARVAAHESGERTNAPLICYLVGLARGRRGRELDDLVDAVVGKPV
jgi:hypothetical protein